MTRPYTGYIEEKQRRLNGAINELLHGPDNDPNMVYALGAIIAYAELIIKDAEWKRDEALDRIQRDKDTAAILKRKRTA